jgi:hypothetical protein
LNELLPEAAVALGVRAKGAQEIYMAKIWPVSLAEVKL